MTNKNSDISNAIGKRTETFEVSACESLVYFVEEIAIVCGAI